MKKTIIMFVLTAFLCNCLMPSVGLAQTLNLPAPDALMARSPAYSPAVIKGILFDQKNPLHFRFIVNTGETGLAGSALEDESRKLIKYFMAGLTTPEKDLWVNLSPYEKNRIIPADFGVTEMGRDLLAQDYILKQLASSLMYPEDELGKSFWTRVRAKAFSLYGVTDIPMDTFNKVWIVPQKAQIYEHNNSVLVVSTHMKVMLEEDYVALQKNMEEGIPRQQEAKAMNGAVATVVREILIPELEKEINEGKNFAGLRQIFNSMVLAVWYKRNLRASLLGQVYVDQNKTPGVDIDDKDSSLKIYAQYLEAFRKGVYNYIKEEPDPLTGDVIPRKYFSGGFGAKNTNDWAQIIEPVNAAQIDNASSIGNVVVDATIAAANPSRRNFFSRIPAAVLASLIPTKIFGEADRFNPANTEIYPKLSIAGLWNTALLSLGKTEPTQSISRRRFLSLAGRLSLLSLAAPAFLALSPSVAQASLFDIKIKDNVLAVEAPQITDQMLENLVMDFQKYKEGKKLYQKAQEFGLSLKSGSQSEIEEFFKNIYPVIYEDSNTVGNAKIKIDVGTNWASKELIKLTIDRLIMAIAVVVFEGNNQKISELGLHTFTKIKYRYTDENSNSNSNPIPADKRNVTHDIATLSSLLLTDNSSSLTNIVPDQEHLGGINLDPAMLDMQIKRDGNGVPLPISQQDSAMMNIQGFSPIINSITATSNFLTSLGIDKP